MERSERLPFGSDAPETAASMAAALAPPAAAGHFDELRAAAAPPLAPDSIARNPELARYWADFFSKLGREGFADLNRRRVNVERQVRDNGISYNVYADAGGPQRPWSLDLFPLIVSPQSWAQIEAGVLQRVQLLEAVLDDIYGPQQLLREAMLPPALVHGHPGYLRAMHGARIPGGTRLHVAAFDLGRDPDGNWWVVSQRTQAPSGLGYLLENRLIVSRMFPDAFRSMRVQRLAGSYRALLEALQRMSPAGEDARVVLLTPGPYNETYFEQSYLARYVGITLVEGSDLTVRDERLYLRTLRGLEPVHCVLKRLDDSFLDPLELRADSRLGVPGLLQAVRAGNVLMANAPGSAFLESPALLGFLPPLARRLLGEELKLPSLATWWCGERAAMEAALPRLAERVIKPTYPYASGTAVQGRSLGRRERDEWAGKIVRQSDEYTVQAYLPLSQMPIWSRGRIAQRSALLRVFAICDGEKSWRVLPGGLTRIATGDFDIASMQRGGSSADAWVLTDGEVDSTTLLQHEQPAAPTHAAIQARPVTSRAAENLFWLGRYTERAENTIRLARVTLDCLNGEHQTSRPLMHWIGALAADYHLVVEKTPSPAQARRVFERSLIAALADTQHATSVGYNLQALKFSASAVRERLSLEQWGVIERAESEFFRQCAVCTQEAGHSSVEALRLLANADAAVTAMTGAQTDRMTRDDGWRLLSIGRQIERLSFLALSLARAFETRAVHEQGGFDAVIALFDSTITFHGRYQQRRDVEALLDLLVIDRDNPRSLAWVSQTLAGRVQRVAANVPGAAPSLDSVVPDPQGWDLRKLGEADAKNEYPALEALLEQCVHAAYRLSDELGTRYFTHSSDLRQSLGV